MKAADLQWAGFYKNPRRLPKDIKRVLVIDDLDSFHGIVSRSLGPHGVSVKGATTGADGLAIARAFLPDLIILDWVLKETSGEEVARLLRLDPATKTIPTIMVSAHIDPCDAHRARAAGAHLFMKKEQLMTVLLSYLPTETPNRSRSRKVLVIEDDDGTQEFIRHLLTEAQRDAIFCRSGREGLEEARRSLPAIILLDLGLPELNGVEVFKLLRADPATRAIPVLIMTSLGDTAGAIDSAIRLLRPDDFIHKPFGGEELVARVLRLLNSPTSNASQADRALQDLVLHRGRIAVNLTRNEVLVQSKPLELTPQLFVLLRLLISQEEPISVERILAEGWSECRDTGVLRKAMQRLRLCLDLQPDPIVNTGRAYKLVG